MKYVRNFYINYVDYLEEWALPFKEIENFNWVTLKKDFMEMQKTSFEYINNHFQKNNIVSDEKLKFWLSLLIQNGRNYSLILNEAILLAKIF